MEDNSNEYKAKELHRVETKNYMDMVLTQNRLVTFGGSNTIQVYNFNTDENISESIDDTDL